MAHATCPSCKRPVALDRPRCLYCGAALPAAPPSDAAAPPTDGHPGDERLLLVVDCGGAKPGVVAAALGLSRFEAQQRIRRGGLDLWRVAPQAQASADVARLEAAGLAVIAIPEAEVREAKSPIVVLGGVLKDGAIEARVGAGKPVRVSGDDLRFILEGPIAREYAPSSDVRKVRIASPDAGYRIHLHRKTDSRPLELDPDAFAFGDSVVGRSSLLTLRDWVRAMAPGVPIDDTFRKVPPALAPATTDGSLSAALGRGARGGGGKKEDGFTVLDNVEQFRFYSSWRAAVERRRS